MTGDAAAHRLPQGRRHLLATALSLTALGATRSLAESPPAEIVLGYQKTGTPFLSKEFGIFEKRFARQNIRIKWAQFESGLLLLQAMDQGSVDFGNSGDIGALFLQAAHGGVVYIAAQPTGPHSEGLLVKAGSPIRRLADLRGKRVGFARGSSSHNVTIAALQSVGFTLNDIVPVNLSASDASFAFAKDAIDAWTVWDPYFSITMAREPTRVLAYTGDVLKNDSGFLLANQTFAERYPSIVRDLIAGSEETGRFADAHRDQTTQALARATGIDPKTMATVVSHIDFNVGPMTPSIIAGQQANADRFLSLGLLPRPIQVKDAVWTPARA